MYMPLCACDVRATKRNAREMSIEKQSKEEVLITWQRRNRRARSTNMKRNKMKWKMKRAGGSEEVKVKAKAEVLKPLEWNKPAPPAGKPQQKQRQYVDKLNRS